MADRKKELSKPSARKARKKVEDKKKKRKAAAKHDKFAKAASRAAKGKNVGGGRGKGVMGLAAEFEARSKLRKDLKKRGHKPGTTSKQLSAAAKKARTPKITKRKKKK